MTTLTPEQLKLVEQWASEGATLNDVQSRLRSELGITLTYLEARLLMVDVGVRLQDKPREKPPEPPAAATVPPEQDPNENFESYEDESPAEVDDPSAAPTQSSLQMSTDTLAVPGTIISGKATFSDGQAVTWYLDQMGRLGLSGAPQGYQPPKADIPLFQRQLDRILQQSGF